MASNRNNFYEKSLALPPANKKIKDKSKNKNKTKIKAKIRANPNLHNHHNHHHQHPNLRRELPQNRLPRTGRTRASTPLRVRPPTFPMAHLRSRTTVEILCRRTHRERHRPLCMEFACRITLRVYVRASALPPNALAEYATTYPLTARPSLDASNDSIEWQQVKYGYTAPRVSLCGKLCLEESLTIPESACGDYTSSLDRIAGPTSRQLLLPL